MDLNLFVTFAAVAEAGSYSRAAEKLGISKALASRHVSALEAALGLKLINRSTRAVKLTDAGSLFHQRCSEILATARDAVQEVSDLRVRPAGLLRISSAISFGRLHLVPALARFSARYPELRFSLELNQDFADLMTSSADVVVRAADEPRLLSYVARPLAPQRWVLCATPDYLARHGAPATPQALPAHPCILYTSNTRREWALRSAAGEAVVRVGGPLDCSSADGIVEAALAHMGIAAAPTVSVAHHLAAGRLVRVLPGWELPPRTLYAAWLPNLLAAPTVNLLVQFLQDEFGDAPPWDRQIGL